MTKDEDRELRCPQASISLSTPVQKNLRSVSVLVKHVETAKKGSRTALLGSALAIGGLLGASLLPSVPAFAADPPHLVAFGPSGVLAVGSSAAITAQVQGATGVPVYQFRIGNKIVQRYSQNSRLSLNHLAAGSYTVTVRSLGMGQLRNRLFGAFRSTVLHFKVGSPHLVAKGPSSGVAKHGTAFIRARVEQATAEPYFHFTVNGTVAQKYSHKNYLTLHHLSPGNYTVEVRSLGPAQFRNHEWFAARTKIITFTVPSATSSIAHLSIAHLSTMTANGTSKETLSITATDSNGKPVANQPVTLVSSDPNVASVSPSTATTDANGVATATVTAGTSSGTSTIEAIANGISSSVQLTTTPEQSAPSLSSMQVSGQQAGSGTSTTPAIAATSTPISVSTTLTRRDGKPASGVNLTYTVMPTTKGGSLSGLVATQNGKTLSGSDVSGGGVSFVVPTDSNGTASLSLTDAGHQTAATVSVAAPYESYKAASPVNLLWANPGTAVLSPTQADSLFGSSTDPGQGAIPITATVIAGPNVTVSNQSVAFSLQSGSSADAYLSSSSSGANNQGRSLSVTTNSHGQATVYADNVPPSSFAGTKTAQVSASVGGKAVDAVGSSSAQLVSLTWGSSGFPAVMTLNQTPSSETTGSPLTISGSVSDVVGHPVSGATLHLVPVSSSGSPNYNGTDSYLVGGQTTIFSSQNPFDSAVTNSKGQFSFTVSDSHSGTDTYAVEYQPLSGSALSFGTSGQTSVSWQPSVTPHTLAVSPSLSGLSSASTTETVQTDESTAVSSYVEALTSSGSPVTLSSSNLPSLSYTLTAGSGSTLTAINGVSLANPASTVNVTILADGSVTANGASVGTVPTGSSAVSFSAEGTQSGTSTIQVTEQSLSATVNLDISGTPHRVVFNPSTILPSSVLNNGPVTETLTVEGAGGHPVPGAQVAIDGSTKGQAPGAFQNGTQNDAIWITKVNGSSLTTTVNNQSRSDAFPLVDAATNLSNLGYQYPTSSSSESFSHGVMNVTANSKGQITLTLRGAGASFWSTANGSSISSSNAAASESSQALSNGTYGLGAWFQGSEIGSAVIGNTANTNIGTAPTSTTASVGAATPLTFTFNDGNGKPIEGAKVTLSSQGLSHATWGTSSSASNDTASGLSKLPTLVTNSKGQVTVYMVDNTSGDSGTVSAAIDGLSLTSGTIHVG